MNTALWIFFILGILTAAIALANLFLPWGRRPRYLWAAKTSACDSDDFLEAFSHALNLPVREGQTPVILNDGSEFFPAIKDALRAAKQTINFMVYIWEPGDTAEEFFDILIDKAKNGVEVRLLLDGVGGLRTPRGRLEELKQAGGKIAWFRTPHIVKIAKFHKRNHRRAIVVDGQIGFTGGAAVGDKWYGWRDMMVRVEGTMAQAIQTTFVQLWADLRGEILVGPKFYPPVEKPGHNKFVCLESSPADESHPLRKMLWLSFNAAAKKLYIVSPYFIPDGTLLRVLQHKADKGVDVRVLVSGERTDAKPILYAARSLYGGLLQAGVRIYEYQPAMMHTKMIVVDGLWSLVGSPNMDIRSSELNQENTLGVLDARFADALEKTFLADLEKAREITLANWQKRSLLRNLFAKMWRLWAEQY